LPGRRRPRAPYRGGGSTSSIRPASRPAAQPPHRPVRLPGERTGPAKTGPRVAVRRGTPGHRAAISPRGSRRHRGTAAPTGCGGGTARHRGTNGTGRPRTVPPAPLVPPSQCRLVPLVPRQGASWSIREGGRQP
jgi:hypothetical protein